MGCLDRPTGGNYLFDGIDTATRWAMTSAQDCGANASDSCSSFRLLPYRTVLENVTLAEMYRGAPAAVGRPARGRPSSGSGSVTASISCQPTVRGRAAGWPSRARSLRSPSLLLCDEPTGNLDSKDVRRPPRSFPAAERGGLTLVVVTHDENVANRAGRRVHLVDGRLTDFTDGQHATRQPVRRRRALSRNFAPH